MRRWARNQAPKQTIVVTKTARRSPTAETDGTKRIRPITSPQPVVRSLRSAAESSVLGMMIALPGERVMPKRGMHIQHNR